MTAIAGTTFIYPPIPISLSNKCKSQKKISEWSIKMYSKCDSSIVEEHQSEEPIMLEDAEMAEKRLLLKEKEKNRKTERR